MKTAGCPFCREIADGSLFLHKGYASVCIPDSNPVSEGHVLVVPRRHIERVEQLESAEWVELFTLVRRCAEDAAATPGVAGINIGVNSGTAAGQTVAHAHVHVIPRRDGDCDDPRGGVRWVLAAKAVYWQEGLTPEAPPR